MKLAIVGSRELNDYSFFCNHVNEFIKEHEPPELIISGGAKGADTLAKRYL